MGTNVDCPICEIDKDHCVEVEKGTSKSLFKCERCGDFILTEEVLELNHRELKNFALSAWARNHKETGREAPEIWTSNLNTIIDSIPKYTAVEKFWILLEAIARRTNFPGEIIDLNPEFDFPLAWASGRKEFRYFVLALRDRGLIRVDSEDVFNDTDLPFKVCIKPQGWEHIESHRMKPVVSDQVFVAMSFNDDMDTVWTDGIEHAIKMAKYRPYRVDKVPHIDRIDAKIEAEIRNSQFLVADVTEQKQGVYFEAGYALGMRLPVIWCVREDEIKKVHFDTRQYRHILWTSPSDLKEQLFDTICATVGKNKT